MVLPRDHHRHLLVTEADHLCEGVLVLGNVDDLIVDAFAIERAIGRGALDAGRLAGKR